MRRAALVARVLALATLRSGPSHETRAHPALVETLSRHREEAAVDQHNMPRARHLAELRAQVRAALRALRRDG